MKKIRVLLTTVLMLCMSAGLASTAYAAESLKTIYPNEVRTNGTEVTTNNGYEFYNYVTSNGDRSSNGSTDMYAGVDTDDMFSSSAANGADIFDIDRANDLVYHVSLKNVDNTQKNVSLYIYMANVLQGTKKHNELKVDTTRISGDLLGTSVDASLPIRYYFTDGTNVARQDVLNGTVSPDWSTLKEVHVQGQLPAGTSAELRIPLKYVESDPTWDTYTNLQVRDYSAPPYKFISLNLVGVRGNKQVSDLMTDKVPGHDRQGQWKVRGYQRPRAAGRDAPGIRGLHQVLHLAPAHSKHRRQVRYGQGDKRYDELLCHQDRPNQREGKLARVRDAGRRRACDARPALQPQSRCGVRRREWQCDFSG